MRFLFSIILATVGFFANADIVKDINGLISRGNDAYRMSQQTLIRECADSVSALLNSGKVGSYYLSDFRASLYKLYGNYHYENANLDSAGYYYDLAQKEITDHPNTDFRDTELHLWRDIAQLRYRRGDYREAGYLLSRADTIVEYDGWFDDDPATRINIKMSYALCLARLRETDRALEIAREELQNYSGDKSSDVEYAKAQRMYGKIQLLADADKKGALKAYKTYFDRQKKFSMENFGSMNSRERSEYWQTLQPFIADCYQLEGTDPGFLYDVTLFSKGLLLQLSRAGGEGAASKDALKTIAYKWSDIRSRLKSGQTAIEFIQYEKDGEQRMAALVLKPTGSPRFVALTNPDKIFQLAEKQMQSTSRNDKDKLYGDSLLQRMVWTDPLLKALSGSKRVYFAPDGYLHRLAIEYMPEVEGMEMYRLTSTRRLMEDADENLTGIPMLLCGGINYQLDSNPGAAADNDSLAYANYRGSSFSRLTDSSNEAKSIYELRENDEDRYLGLAEASEAIFRELAPEYGSILISTHGNFSSSLPAISDMKPIADDGSMSKNIFAMAGANDYLDDSRFDPTANCDGLLSAQELSQMNLSGCRLFTVSACQSGLGEISSDGVFGIQRGLKNSGVGAMLLSLWNVESEATACLMKEFYTRLSNGQTIASAFRDARKAMMTQSEPETNQTTRKFFPSVMASREVTGSEDASYNSPQFTNAYILIDAID